MRASSIAACVALSTLVESVMGIRNWSKLLGGADASKSDSGMLYSSDTSWLAPVMTVTSTNVFCRGDGDTVRALLLWLQWKSFHMPCVMEKYIGRCD